MAGCPFRPGATGLPEVLVSLRTRRNLLTAQNPISILKRWDQFVTSTTNTAFLSVRWISTFRFLPVSHNGEEYVPTLTLMPSGKSSGISSLAWNFIQVMKVNRQRSRVPKLTTVSEPRLGLNSRPIFLGPEAVGSFNQPESGQTSNQPESGQTSNQVTRCQFHGIFDQVGHL